MSWTVCNSSLTNLCSDPKRTLQVPTFLVAGHKTTRYPFLLLATVHISYFNSSTGTTWALHSLTQDLRVQTKLREELLTVDTDTPTMDELNALPYIDMVVRETMHVHAPVASTTRISMKDDVLPLNAPSTDMKGTIHDRIRYIIFHVKMGCSRTRIIIR
jgi:hypothetical protein